MKSVFHLVRHAFLKLNAKHVFQDTIYTTKILVPQLVLQEQFKLLTNAKFAAKNVQLAMESLEIVHHVFQGITFIQISV